jgi:tRNA(fMet)-specific endonuclease VapC
MTYLLDTNACIYYLNGSHPALVERVLEAGPQRLAVSSVTVAELHFGAARSGRPRANRDRVRALLRELETSPFDDDCAEIFGRLKSELFKAGTPLTDFDIAIAASALAGGRTLVTSDSDMRKIRGLSIEDWTAARRP